MSSGPAGSDHLSLLSGTSGRVCLRHFRWLSPGEPQPAHDLRRLGWALSGGETRGGETWPGLIDDIGRANALPADIRRRSVIVIGIESSDERAAWLAKGFGDALSARLSIAELEMRTMRLHHAIESLPRRRRHGPLALDLLTRDGMNGDRRLGLHPREFSLLWRLAETPGQPVQPDELLAEVWRMTFRPETNSLAVHVCRLRAKLAAAGLGGIVGTTPDGSYYLAVQRDGPDPLRRRLAM